MTTFAEGIAQERIRDLEAGLRETREALKTYEALTADLRFQLGNALALLDRVSETSESFAVGLSE